MKFIRFWKSLFWDWNVFSVGGGVGEAMLIGSAIGATAGGASSAIRGGNILEGMLTGAGTGAVGGGLGTALGAATSAAAPAATEAATTAGTQAATQASTQAATQAAAQTAGTGVGTSVTPAVSTGTEQAFAQAAGNQGIGALDSGMSISPGIQSGFASTPGAYAPQGAQLGGIGGSAPGSLGGAESQAAYQSAITGGYNPSANLDSAYVDSMASRIAPTQTPPPGFLDQTKQYIAGNPLSALGIATSSAASAPGPKQEDTGPQDYKGPLSKIKFDPNTYTPYVAQPSVYTPSYAEGGIAQLSNTNFMNSGMYPTSQQDKSFYATPSQMPTSAQQVAASYEPQTNPLTGAPTANMAQGGIAQLNVGGRLVDGAGDGMSDSIRANIDGRREARLASGEFVIPADVVSHMGNGSTDAGAKQLYNMMDRIRQARVGTTRQGRQINPNRYMPA